MPNALLLPLSGFELHADASLFLKGSGSDQWVRCNPHQLEAEAFKQLLWMIEDALGAFHNDLQQVDPLSFPAFLRVIVLCLQQDPAPRGSTVLSWKIRGFKHVKPSGRPVLESVAYQFPSPPVPSGVQPADLGCVGGISAAAGFAFAPATGLPR
jgi:hypothetical protein